MFCQHYLSIINHLPWLTIKAAQTRTLTRPDYSSIIPLTRANGSSKTLDWRNKTLEPGLSNNTDLSISFLTINSAFLRLTTFKSRLKISSIQAAQESILMRTRPILGSQVIMLILKFLTMNSTIPTELISKDGK